MEPKNLWEQTHRVAPDRPHRRSIARAIGVYVLACIGLVLASVSVGTAEEQGLGMGLVAAGMFASYGWFVVPVLLVIGLPPMAVVALVVANSRPRSRIALGAVGGGIWLGYFALLQIVARDVVMLAALAPTTVLGGLLDFLAGAAFAAFSAPWWRASAPPST